jgi:hypothetical protein
MAGPICPIGPVGSGGAAVTSAAGLRAVADSAVRTGSAGPRGPAAVAVGTGGLNCGSAGLKGCGCGRGCGSVAAGGSGAAGSVVAAIRSAGSGSLASTMCNAVPSAGEAPCIASAPEPGLRGVASNISTMACTTSDASTARAKRRRR